MSVYLRVLIATTAIALAAAVATLTTPSFGDTAQCVRLVPTQTGEKLVNLCQSCRMATVMRSRTASQTPVSRQFSLRPRSEFDLPFKGPGRTRITVDTACEGTPGAAPNIAAEAEAAADRRKCMRLTAAPDGGLQLVNGCTLCRTAEVRRIDAAAKNYADESFSVPGGKVAPVPAKGYAHAVVIAEAACF